jgi:hypothetical protein
MGLVGTAGVFEPRASLALPLRQHQLGHLQSRRYERQEDRGAGLRHDRGEIDACTAIRPQTRVTAGDPTVIDRWGGTQIHDNPRMRKLCEDDGKAVVFEYYRRTGFFQANHHVIVQNRILREHPWVALELCEAFRRSKEIAYERARRAEVTHLYFPGKDREEQRAVLGDDPYPLGLNAMGRNIERAIRGSLEQGLLTKPLQLEDIYYRTTLRT